MEHRDQGYIVRTEQGTEFYSSAPPIRATGFRRGTEAVQELFDYREDGEILRTEEDESTIAPGLFLTGPDEYEQNQMLLTELSPGEREQVLVSAALLSRARRIETESILY